MKEIVLIFLSVVIIGCVSEQENNIPYNSETLQIEEIDHGVWIHTSYLEMPDHSRFPCNGMIFSSEQEAVVFDTPVDNKTAHELIHWIETTKGFNIKAVVVNHFHNDCLGGLKEFHNQKIMSYAFNETIKLAKEKGGIEPQNGFEELLELQIGNEKTVTKFLGAGHTIDNVVSYLPSQKILFGGCLVKSLGSGKGNLSDADTTRWAETIQKVKIEFPLVNIVVPGHGAHGGFELLDYTMEMFAAGK